MQIQSQLAKVESTLNRVRNLTSNKQFSTPPVITNFLLNSNNSNILQLQRNVLYLKETNITEQANFNSLQSECYYNTIKIMFKY